MSIFCNLLIVPPLSVWNFADHVPQVIHAVLDCFPWDVYNVQNFAWSASYHYISFVVMSSTGSILPLVPPRQQLIHRCIQFILHIWWTSPNLIPGNTPRCGKNPICQVHSHGFLWSPYSLLRLAHEGYTLTKITIITTATTIKTWMMMMMMTTTTTMHRHYLHHHSIIHSLHEQHTRNA
jgi:hypothetical protein